MSRIRITKPGGPTATMVEIDEVDIAGSITQLQLKMGAGRVTWLTVELMPDDIIFDGEGQVRAELSEQLVKVLIALGWTPPISDEPLLTFQPGSLTVKDPS